MVTRILLVLALGACSSSELMPPVVRARTGPASGRPVTRVVAVPGTCGTYGIEQDTPSANNAWIPASCDAQAVAGVDQAIRSGLEFRGLHVIDSEEVNAVTATRHETQVTKANLEPGSGGTIDRNTAITTEVVGARFEDATPIEQAQILAELRADAVLHTRLWVGSSPGNSARRTVIAQVQLTTASDRVLVWARRCELEISGMITNNVAMEHAARCAIEAVK